MSPLMVELENALQRLLPVSDQRYFRFPPIEFREAPRSARRSS
jgi:hypothetical protein